MTDYIGLEQGLRVARRAVGGPIEVRDLGLFDAALLRPQTSLFGRDAYPDLMVKAAALLRSVVASHPFVDGDERAGWLLTYVFLARNGVELDPVDDDPLMTWSSRSHRARRPTWTRSQTCCAPSSEAARGRRSAV